MTADETATPRRSRIEVVVPDDLLPAAIRDLDVPDLTPVRLPVVPTELHDPGMAAANAVADALRDTVLDAGARVAVALGSRGLGAYPELVAGVLSALRAAGAAPFLMPAMGSHGGGTPEGQTRVLTDYGLVRPGTTVDADDATTVIGRLEDGTALHASQVALSADAIVVLNRVKSHTGFRGRIESGLTKMLVVGLGKRPGAAALHAKGYEGFASRLEQARDALLRAYPPVIGVAVVEDASGRPARIEAVPGAWVAEREPELLRDAKRRMPRLPFEKLDLLVVERAGKDVSGLGMDPNVTGRHPSGLHEPPDPTRIALLSLTDASEGNAIGMGHADVVPRSFADAIDPVATWTNAITSTSLASARLPVVMPDAASCVRLALATCGVDPKRARVAWIRDTGDLAELRVSDAALAAARAAGETLAVLGPAAPVPLART
ncbi:MAG: hypothetical protein U5J97_09040 [Trueperaceae bacterium]|nr:hypothetical protein [Trueperaceae bacterium]